MKSEKLASKISKPNLAIANMTLAEIMVGVTPTLMSQYKIENYFGAPQGNEVW